MDNIRIALCSACLGHLLAPTCTTIIETCHMTFQCIKLWRLRRFYFAAGIWRRAVKNKVNNLNSCYPRETTQESNIPVFG